MISRVQITRTLALARVPGSAREREVERAVNEGREKPATEILDSPRAKWAAGLALPAVRSGRPAGRSPTAQLSGGGGGGQTGTL